MPRAIKEAKPKQKAVGAKERTERRYPKEDVSTAAEITTKVIVLRWGKDRPLGRPLHSAPSGR